MKSLRPPSKIEKNLLLALLQGSSAAPPVMNSVDGLLVADMDDGGMGSLLLFPSGVGNASRSFGRQLVLAEFQDSDGVLVSVALNLDTQGNLYELDVWKVDFSPLLKWPDPAAVRIVAAPSVTGGQQEHD
jgi:hypothetical protein